MLLLKKVHSWWLGFMLMHPSGAIKRHDKGNSGVNLARAVAVFFRNARP
jgi:hypothetical protein